MRSIWKGYLRFSLVTIPIRVYNAVDTTQRIRFTQLHVADNGRVHYDKRCSACGEAVRNEDIRKGYEYEPGRYVVVEASDLENIKLTSTKIIDIEGFVDADDTPTTLYDAPYLVGPDGPVAARSYSLLSEALRQTGKLGVGRVVLRDREDAVLVGAHEGGIILYKIRYPGSVRRIADVPQIQHPAPDSDQLELATQLIQSLTMPLDKIPLEDRYQAALKDLIAAKLDGKAVVAAPEQAPQVIDIMEALKASIQRTQPKKAKRNARRKKAA